eukprot:SAG22_NODE_16404_length_326_cov_0.471366_1_plen_57_part_01
MFPPAAAIAAALGLPLGAAAGTAADSEPGPPPDERQLAFTAGALVRSDKARAPDPPL